MTNVSATATALLLLLARSTLGFVNPTAFAPRRLASPLAASSAEKNIDEFSVGILGDLHMDPRHMEDYGTARQHWLPLEVDALVSLGDLGESKAVDSEEELFSGTTRCHELAADYLRSFGVPYELVGGNHDLEGIDEFATDKENLDMLMRVHGKPTPQFIRQVADKTLLVGLTSTIFRDAKYSSHEVTIDEEQLAWFEEVVENHPAPEGWKIFVFTHAPPNGSGLKVLPENHVVNGCCWLNHSNEKESRSFIELVRKHRSIKAWFSAHFHLGQDYENSITFPDDENEDRGSCVFVQTSVMRSGTSRDGCQQSRLIRGNQDGFEICTVDHKRNGKVRLDATVTYSDCDHEVGVYANSNDDEEEDDVFVQEWEPRQDKEDGPYPVEDNLVDVDDSMVLDDDVSKDTTAWWYLACGRVLGMFNGMLIEYDPSTLAPLGLVVGADELLGKQIAVIDSGLDEDADSEEDDSNREQAVVLIDDTDGHVVVVQPNEDGSYWRKIVRNKMVRMQEMRREKAAKEFAEELLEHEVENVVSSWGPYKTTSGTARRTGVEGVTTSNQTLTP